MEQQDEKGRARLERLLLEDDGPRASRLELVRSMGAEVQVS
jgi:hypothetical protein